MSNGFVVMSYHAFAMQELPKELGITWEEFVHGMSFVGSDKIDESDDEQYVKMGVRISVECRWVLPLFGNRKQ